MEKIKEEITYSFTNGYHHEGDSSLRALHQPVATGGSKVYKRRWFMLFIFVFVSMANSFLWLQYSIITDIVMKYYSIDSQTVNWTASIFMIVYVPLIFPGAWLMEKWGLRWTVIIGAGGTAAAAWINVLAVNPDRFYVAMIAQTVASVTQIFVLSVPANLAAVWFGPEQVSTACSIGVFGNQVGIALGFILPPIAVNDHEDLELVGAEMSRMFYIVAGTFTVIFILVLFGFQDKPPLPPTTIRASVTASPNYYQSIKRLVTNPAYMLLLITYGMNTGVYYAMSTLLNQTVLSNFPGENDDAGRIGLTIIIAGLVGALLCGLILDRTHRFKETALVVYWLGLFSMIAYTFTFQLGYISVTYITAGTVGFFVTGYLPVGFEYAVELTYPEPEVTSSGLLNGSANLFGYIFIMVGGVLLEDYGDLICNGVLSAVLLIGAIMTFLIRSDLKRQKAINNHIEISSVDTKSTI